MKIFLKRVLVAGYNHGVLCEGFVKWLFVKFDLRSV
nr:MAG TPA: hypothetical protein [Caudoviricetes sp.]